MPNHKNHDLAILVQQWLVKANSDIDLARFLLDEKTNFLDAIAFNSQQAAEKYLKAYLTYRQVPFPKTHDIREILKLIATVNEKLSKDLRDISTLTPYGAEIRYPGDAPKVSPSEAESAFRLAGKAQRKIMTALGPAFRSKANPKVKNGGRGHTGK